MIRHFTHQLFSYGFVAYKQCKSLNFAFRLFLKDAMSHHVARSYSFGNLSNLIREFHARILKCHIVNLTFLVSYRICSSREHGCLTA